MKFPLAVLLLLILLQGCAAALRWEGGGAGPSSLDTPVPATYTVVPGDTLYSIAFRHNLNHDQVAQWNGLGGTTLIRPGQVLRLRAPTTTASASAPASGGAVVRREAPPPAPSASRPPASRSPVAGPVAQRRDWIWPSSGKVVREFKPPESKGIDIAAKLGDPVHAAAPGRVVYSGSALKGYGELVIIKHDDNYLSAYGYNRKRLVKEGDQVTSGQRIAEVGLGPAQQPVLHFEIRERGKPVDPLKHLP